MSRTCWNSNQATRPVHGLPDELRYAQVSVVSPHATADSTSGNIQADGQSCLVYNKW